MPPDKDSSVRASAVCLCRNFVNRQPDAAYIQELAPLAKDPDKIVRMQLAMTLGQINTALADKALEPILREAAGDSAFLEALLAGFAAAGAGRESEFIAREITLSSAGARPNHGARTCWGPAPVCFGGKGNRWRSCASCTLRRRTGRDAQAWQQIALLEGLTSMPAKGGSRGAWGKVRHPREW